MFITILFTLFVIFMFQSIEIHVQDVKQEFNENHVQERVYLNQKINIDDDTVYVFETKPYLSADECIEECKLRLRCSFVNHHKYAQLCYMIAASDHHITLNISSSNGFMYAKKVEWNMKLHDANCTSCNINQTCQLSKTKRCIFTGCGPPPLIANTTILGNIFRVGSKLKYKCQDKLQMTKDSQSQISCQSTGTWTESKIQCVGYPCKDNTTSDNETSCYFIEATMKTWEQSKDNCEKKGAHLVHIGSTNETKYLKSFLNSFLERNNREKNTQTVHMHIGISDNSSINGNINCVKINGTNHDNRWSYNAQCLSSDEWWSFCEYELQNTFD